MAVARRATSTVVTSVNGGTSFNITYPTNAVGDVLVLAVTATVAVTTPANWTLILSDQSVTTARLYVFVREVTSVLSGTQTVSHAAGIGRGAITSYSGASLPTVYNIRAQTTGMTQVTSAPLTFGNYAVMVVASASGPTISGQATATTTSTGATWGGSEAYDSAAGGSPSLSLTDGALTPTGSKTLHGTLSTAVAHVVAAIALPETGADIAAPTVPTGLGVTSVTASGATASWTASTDNVAVTGYEVAVLQQVGAVDAFTSNAGWTSANGSSTSINSAVPGTGEFWRARTSGPAQMQRTFTGLTVGQAYTVRCTMGGFRTDRADPVGWIGVTGIGDGDRFLLQPYTTTMTAVSHTFTATATSHTVTLNGTGGGNADNDIVADDVALYATTLTTTASTSQVLTGLAASTDYLTAVRARDAAANWSVLTAPVSFTTTSSVVVTSSGTASAVASASRAVASTRTAAGTGSATATASRVSSSTRTVSGTAAAVASTSRTTATTRVKVGSATAAASATRTAAGVRTSVGTATGYASATGTAAGVRTRAGTATAGASAGGTQTSTRTAVATAGAEADASETAASTRTTVGTAPAEASATGVAEQTLEVIRTSNGTATAHATTTRTSTTVRTAVAAGVAYTTATGTLATARATTSVGIATLTAAGTTTTTRTGTSDATAHATATGVTVNESGWHDITVTATLNPPRWGATLTIRDNRAELGERRWAGDTQPRDNTATLTPRRWKAEL